MRWSLAENAPRREDVPLSYARLCHNRTPHRGMRLNPASETVLFVVRLIVCRRLNRGGKLLCTAVYDAIKFGRSKPPHHCVRLNLMCAGKTDKTLFRCHGCVVFMDMWTSYDLLVASGCREVAHLERKDACTVPLMSPFHDRKMYSKDGLAPEANTKTIAKKQRAVSDSISRFAALAHVVIDTRENICRGRSLCVTNIGA